MTQLAVLTLQAVLIVRTRKASCAKSQPPA